MSNKGLTHLMDRLSNFKERDPVLLKVIRNISTWTFNQQNDMDANDASSYKWRTLWGSHVRLLVTVACTCENHDVLVEVFGCLANITAQDLPVNYSWGKLLRDNPSSKDKKSEGGGLLTVFNRLLVPGMAQPDLLLEIVLLLGTMASCSAACETIASSNLMALLYQLWKDRGEDPEIRLQLIFLFYKLFQHESSREEAMYSTRIVVDLIECLGHSNQAIRQTADMVTDLVLELDRQVDGSLGQLGLQIRKRRFEAYNQLWLREVERPAEADFHRGPSQDQFYEDSIVTCGAEEKYAGEDWRASQFDEQEWGR